jgi:hypothetical protein
MNYGSSEEEACKAEAGEEVDGEKVDGEEVNRPSQNRKEEEINLQRRGARPRAFFIPLKKSNSYTTLRHTRWRVRYGIRSASFATEHSLIREFNFAHARRIARRCIVADAIMRAPRACLQAGC